MAATVTRARGATDKGGGDAQGPPAYGRSQPSALPLAAPPVRASTPHHPDAPLALSHEPAPFPARSSFGTCSRRANAGNRVSFGESSARDADRRQRRASQRRISAAHLRDPPFVRKKGGSVRPSAGAEREGGKKRKSVAGGSGWPLPPSIRPLGAWGRGRVRPGGRRSPMATRRRTPVTRRPPNKKQAEAGGGPRAAAQYSLLRIFRKEHGARLVRLPTSLALPGLFRRAIEPSFYERGACTSRMDVEIIRGRREESCKGVMKLLEMLRI